MNKTRLNIGNLYLLFAFYFIIINSAVIFPCFHDLNSDFNFYNAKYASIEKVDTNEFNYCSGLTFNHLNEEIRKIEDCHLCMILSVYFYEINFKYNFIDKISSDKKILFNKSSLPNETIYLKIPTRAPPKNII